LRINVLRLQYGEYFVTREERPMKFGKSLYILAVLSFLFLPLNAAAIGIEAALGVWNVKPQGDLAYRGDPVSLEDDLKLGYDVRIFGRVKVDMPLMIPNIYFMFSRVKNDGDGSSTGDFVFGDILFSNASPLSSSLEMDEYDLALYYGIPFIKTATLGKLNIDAGLNIKLVDLDVTVSQSGVSESKQYTVPLPMLYLGGQLQIIKSLSLEAEARIISLGSADYFYDLLGRVKYNLIGPAFIAAGYRYEDAQLDRRGLRISSWTGGPFLEIGLFF